MEVKQIAGLVNAATNEVLGASVLLLEDLSNVVDVGTAIFDARAIDNYVRSLVDHIGRVIFVDRPYRGSAPSVLMDGWEYGAVLEKISADMPEATENESWELTDGKSYDPYIFRKPSVSAKFFSRRVTFEVQRSITERQVKSAFSSPTQLNGFMSMLYGAVERSMTVKMDALVMRTINNMTAETVSKQYGSVPFSDASGVRAVNLLYLYNQQYSTSLTASKALTDADFIRFASYKMGTYVSRLGKMSTLFNAEGKERFTPPDMLHVVLLDDFKQAAATFLQSDTFNKELVSLPASESVPYWQGTGLTYDFEDISTIRVKPASSPADEVTVPGIIGVMFDRDALGVCNLDRRVTTAYNAKAEFFNNFYKFDAGYFNDFAENFVVFFVA